MKYILLIFLFLSFYSRAQTLIDSMSVNPNPFQSKTLIYFSFTNNDTVSINVINVVGATILSPITNSIMTAGVYQDSLIMSSYADGMYFVQLKLGHRKTITKKAIKSSTAGIENNSNIVEPIKIYPNPANNLLNIKSENFSNEIYKIEMYNNLSQLIRAEELHFEDGKASINTKDLQNGIYFLVLNSNNSNNLFKRFVISR